MAEAHGSVGPIGTNRARSVKRRHALPYNEDAEIRLPIRRKHCVD
jgi:hypothetical protein